MNNKQIRRLTGRKVESANKVDRAVTNSRRARSIIVMLAIIAALQMISFGIIMPIFPRRLGDFGGGVEALGLMAMAYSLASIIASPFMGSLADRFGRRPLLLGSLAAYVAAFTGYLFATSAETFFVMRALAGALTAGLGPAAMGIVADVAPDNERARWIGVVGGGGSVGWIIGPALGGMLYDKWGYTVPFILSVVMATIALTAAAIMIPETRTYEAQQQQTHRRKQTFRQSRGAATAQHISIWDALPRPLSTFAVLLSVSFIMILAWTFAEPQLMFYIYDDLGWTSARFGLAISGYGVASFIGQVVPGRSSDRFGRLSIIIVGLLLHSAQYVGMMLTDSFQLILMAYILAGLGEALVSPALGAYYLDITPEQHKSRVMGIKGSVGSLGSVMGPLLAVVASRSLAPQNVFLISVVLLVLATLLVLLVLRKQGQAAEESGDIVVAAEI